MQITCTTKSTKILLTITLYENDFNIIDLVILPLGVSYRCEQFTSIYEFLFDFLNFLKLVLKLSYGFGLSNTTFYRPLSYKKKSVLI